MRTELPRTSGTPKDQQIRSPPNTCLATGSVAVRACELGNTETTALLDRLRPSGE